MKAGLSRVGLYLRLSHDDGAGASIEHQRMILRAYAEEHGGDVVDEYVDDGFSGTTFERPAVKRLLADAEAGRIDTVIVKDLSRFGRNYIQVGQYLDYVFPACGVRFIALGDQIDTADRLSSAMDFMPIVNVFNEWHAANTSRKIRAVLDASRRAGKFTNWAYPYGYRAGDDGCRTAVVVPEEAETVRKIYGLRLGGGSSRAIAATLNGEGIPAPASRIGEKRAEGRAFLWVPKTVMHILKDPTYLGMTVQHRTARVSYKNRQTVRVPSEEWIVKEHAHPPIVSREVWERVQAVNRAASGGKAAKKPHMLSGLLYCADCGGRLRLCGGGERAAYVCRTYKDRGRTACTPHRIEEAALQSLLAREIGALAEAAGEQKQEFTRALCFQTVERVEVGETSEGARAVRIVFRRKPPSSLR